MRRTRPATGRPPVTKLKKRKISNRTVEALPAERDDTVFWDRRLPGFGVRVYGTGARVYLAQARGPRGTRRVTLGRHGIMGAGEARLRAERAIARIRAGEDPVPGCPTGPTVAEAARQYMDEHVAVRCKPATARIRGVALRRHILPALGGRSLAGVAANDVIALHEAMADTPGLANIAVATLSQVFRKAERWGLVPAGTDPCGAVRKYRSARRERFLTDVELRRLGQVLDEARQNGGASPASLAAIRLLMLTGCRKSEILTLRWEDIDLGACELRLRDAKTGPRTVPLSPSAVALLSQLPRSPNGWVIRGSKPGTHLLKLGNAWRRLRARAGLDDVRLHDLRHSYASRALALGENLPMIGKLLGHRRIESTARYAHLSRNAVHEAANRVANSLAEDIF